MGKIGRNDPCPCGSGRKYKKCCIGKAAAPAQPQIPSVTREVAKIQEKALAKEDALLSLGVFILFSTTEGDAWLLEVTEMDAIQVASGGEKIDVEINENPETIEINWTHKFTVRKKKFVLTAYSDNSEETKDDYPAHSILSVMKKIRKRIPPELLSSIHIDDDDEAAA